MADKIKGAEHRLSDVFSNQFVFEIPNYQRPYSWTTEQAEELLDDLLAFLGVDEPVDELPPYFLGSVVLIKEDERPEAQVVDGQQRLTTLTVLLAVLRSLVPDTYADEVEAYLFEKGSKIQSRPDRPRLTLRDRDAEFFREYVQKGDGIERLAALPDTDLSDPRKNLRDNALRLRSRLAAVDEDVRVRLLSYLIQKCYLVVVSTPDLDSAYRIFSVLNDRGMDLSPTDILKADVIGQLADDEAKEATYTKRWEDIEEDLGLDRFRELFGHIRTIYRKAKAKDTLLREFRAYVDPAEDPTHFVDDVLDPFARAFVTVRNSNYSAPHGAEAVNESLRWLDRLDNSDWVPPAILFLARHRHDPDRVARFFRALERLASVMFVSRANVNYRLERYGRLLSAIESGDEWGGEGTPLELTPKEMREALDQLDGDLYAVRKIRLFVLLRLDAALSQGEARYDLPIVTVEHVLPQNPKDGSVWREWFPTDELRDRYVHTLANLVLLSERKNSEAQNFDFDEKKRRYFTSAKGTSPFALTSQVLTENEWTPAVLDARQRRLLGVLTDLWDLHDAEPPADARDALTNSDGFAYYYARSSPSLRARFDRLRSALDALGDDVEVVEHKTYVAFKRDGSNFACVIVQPAEEVVKAWLPLDPGSVPLQGGLTRDVTGVGHAGTGDLEVSMASEADDARARALFRQSYAAIAPEPSPLPLNGSTS